MEEQVSEAVSFQHAPTYLIKCKINLPTTSTPKLNCFRDPAD